MKADVFVSEEVGEWMNFDGKKRSRVDEKLKEEEEEEEG